jgi:hypothetical protein
MKRRIIFPKGKQREFLNEVIKKVSSPSLRGLLQFGLDLNYSTLKNYYIEDRTIPQEVFSQLCSLSGISPLSLNFSYLDENWGKVKGGKSLKRR